MAKPKKKHGHGSGGASAGGGKGHKGGKKFANLPPAERRLLLGIESQSQTSPVPALAADPQIEAQRLAAQRGAEDLIRSTFTGNRQARRDERTNVSDLILKRTRGRQDYGTQLRQGLLGIRQKREDVALKLTRGTEDFGTRLSNLVRTSNIKGGQQLQQANAQGVADAGTLAAGEAARAQNLAVARKPLDVGLSRLQQDTAVNQQRLGVQRHQLRGEVHRGLTRLGQDVHHDVLLSHRDLHRTVLANNLQRNIGLREQAIGDPALVQSEIFSARQNFPGGFAAAKKKYPASAVPGAAHS